MDIQVFSEHAEDIEAAGGDAMTSAVADLFDAADEDIGIAARFVQGDVFPAWDDRTLGVGPSLMYDALAAASGTTAEEVEDRVADVGDPGEVCEQLDLSPDTGQVTLGSTTDALTLADVYATFEEIAAIEGSGSRQRKVDAIKNLLFDCTPQDAKYITRLLLGEMRIGVGEGTVRDALAEAFDIPSTDVERAMQVTNDVEDVAKTARREGMEGLQELEMVVGRPVKPMLAQKGAKTEAIADAGHEGVVAVETKFDGARLQLHLDGDDVQLFTRRMNEVTESMPDVCDIVRERVDADRAVLDCEVVAYESEDAAEPLPFQEVMKRLRRKYDIEEKAEEIHLDIHVFDIIYTETEGALIGEPLSTRRDQLEAVCDSSIVAAQHLVDSVDDIADIEEEALASGNEGVMVKNPESTYQPASRGKNWLKIKPDVETLDCVVVGGEWGEGRRAEWIGSFMLAVRDSETGELQTVGKVATGLTDAELASLTERFEPLIMEEDGKDIEFAPEIVFEVGYEELQPSPQYSSGYGLRFPRFITVREDKAVEDADSLERLERLASDD